MIFAYARVEDINAESRGSDFVEVLILQEYWQEVEGTDDRVRVSRVTWADADRNGTLIETVKSDDLIDAQMWLMGDPCLAIFGSEETLKEEHPDDWQDFIGKTRFHRLATSADYFKDAGLEYGEVSWR